MQSRAVRAVEAEDSGEDEKEIGILSSAHNQENAGAAIAVALPAELELPPSPISHHIHEESSRIFLSGHRSRNCGSLTVRSTNAKDRHSKVRTAKGLRDRRVRLSAPTAIQFFEIQDRLGFDQPSKAVDWLIQHARSAIDELAPIAIAIAEPQKKQKQKQKQELQEKELPLRSFAHPSAAIDRHLLSRQISDDSSSKKSFRSNPNPNPNPNAAQSQSSPDSAPLPPSCIHLHSSRLNPNPNPNVSQSQTLQQQQQQAGSVVLDGVARRAMARERARERVILRGKSRLSSSHMKRSAQELELDQAAEIAPSPPWKKLSTSAAVLLPMLPPPSPSPSPSPQTQTPPVKHLQVLSDLLLQSSSSSSSSSSSASKSQLRNPSRIPAPSPLQAQFRTESGASHGEVPCTARHRLDPDTGCCAAPPSPPKFNQNSEHHSPRGTLQSINLCNLSTIASATSTDCAITASDHSYIQVYHHHHHLLPQSPPSPFLHHHRHHMDYHQQQMQLLHSQNHMNAAAPSLLMMQGSEMPNSSLSPAPATATNSLYMHEADQLGLGRHSHHHHCILPPSDALSRRRSSMAGLIYLMQDQFLPKPDN